MGARFYTPVQTGPGTHPASCTMGTRSFPGIKSGRSVTLTPHPCLVPWSRKGRTIHIFPNGLYGLYRASVPVQGVHFTFTLLTYFCVNLYVPTSHGSLVTAIKLRGAEKFHMFCHLVILHCAKYYLNKSFMFFPDLLLCYTFVLPLLPPRKFACPPYY